MRLFAPPLSISPQPYYYLFTHPQELEIDDMGKRHNRKRTRSRPRNRNNNHDNSPPQVINHTRSESVSTTSSTLSATSSCFHPQGSIASANANHWQQTYTAWQTRLRLQQEQEQELETQRLRIFGGLPEDERTLMEPMLKVVTDLFDGFYDYEDP